MPWSENQAQLLRELGISWVKGVPQPPQPVLPQPEQAAPDPALAAEAPAAVRTPPTKREAQPEPAVASGSMASYQRPELAVAQWPELQAAVSTCQACSLCGTRTQTVFGTGSLSAQWMVVGEAPGEEEDRQGLPFVGASGRLLDQMLRALQLSRQAGGPHSGLDPAKQVYIANALKCRPPGNRNPQPEELARCEPFLLRQIDLLQPRIILAMGRFAVQALLATNEPIGKLRGRVHRYHGVPLVVTYHPAYLLRNPLDKAKSWADLCLAADTFEQLAPASAKP